MAEERGSSPLNTASVLASWPGRLLYVLSPSSHPVRAKGPDLAPHLPMMGWKESVHPGRVWRVPLTLVVSIAPPAQPLVASS